MSNLSILHLSKQTLSQLKIKHLDNGNGSAHGLINRLVKEIHPIVFDATDEQMKLAPASITKSGSGSPGSGLDSWRRMLISNSIGTASPDFRKSIADYIKKLFSQRINFEKKSLEGFIAWQNSR